jgi:flavin reductase (DIM6/NTAB) family NADH-FMN oxidoreductase RutF
VQLVLDDLSVQERYKFLSALIIPRPIALVTSRNAEGAYNAAPFSFFNMFSEDPAVIVLGFSSRSEDRTQDTRKDTLRNIERTGAFVVNMVDRPMAEAMNVCATDFPPGFSEVEAAGFTLTPSRFVAVDRIAQSPASLECRLYQRIPLSFRRFLVLGEILCVHVSDEIIDPKTRRVIPERYDPLARLYGVHYAWLGERFQMAIEPFEDWQKRQKTKG